MEVDERPTEQYSDIGGLDKQIQEVLFTLRHLCRATLQSKEYGENVHECFVDFIFQFATAWSLIVGLL